jgi:hypothetical protein
VIPPRAAHDEVLAVERDGRTELSTALKDRRMDRANVAPTFSSVSEDVNDTGRMQRLNRLAWRTDGEPITMDGDRAAEVSMRIEARVLDRRIAGPALVVQSRRVHDRWRETKILVVP